MKLLDYLTTSIFKVDDNQIPEFTQSLNRLRSLEMDGRHLNLDGQPLTYNSDIQLTENPQLLRVGKHLFSVTTKGWTRLTL
jgi:hypothetical protein